MRWAAGLAIVVVALLLGALWTRGRTEPLDLGAAPDLATGERLVALDPPACRAALDRAGVRYTFLARREDGPRCGYDDAVRLERGGSRAVALTPSGPPLACPVAAGLAAWEWQVVQPAALRSFGSPVVGIDHLGSYACRHVAGQRVWSEHARANAIDVAAFRFADGRRVTVRGDWRKGTAAATFLSRVRDGACPLFATVLSPDYNAAHRDHLHLDQAGRGGWGWRACR